MYNSFFWHSMWLRNRNLNCWEKIYLVIKCLPKVTVQAFSSFLACWKILSDSSGCICSDNLKALLSSDWVKHVAVFEPHIYSTKWSGKNKSLHIICIYGRVILKQFALTSNAISTFSSSEDAFAIANTVKIYSWRSTFPCPNWKIIYINFLN